MKSISSNVDLHLLPMSSQILPQGLMQLRIVEQSQIRLVVESSKNKQGFGIVDFNALKTNSIGTRVEIIDFYPLDGGTFGITIQGKERFVVNDITTKDDLLMSNVSLMQNWETSPDSTEQSELAQKLSDIFMDYPQLDKLYKNKKFEDIAWLCQRWLEILPMPVNQKQDLIAQNSYDKTLQHLNNMMLV